MEHDNSSPAHNRVNLIMCCSSRDQRHSIPTHPCVANPQPIILYVNALLFRCDPVQCIPNPPN